MVLNILERLLLLQCLPQQGSLVTLRVIGDLRMALAPAPDEITKFKIKDGDNGRTTWADDVDTDAEIPICDVAKGIIVKALETMNKGETLTPQHLTLCDKFIPDEGKG